MDINNIILAVVIVGVIGLVFGLLLSFASVIFKVETDEREERILAVLPGANCGACGFAGCGAYAAAIVGEGVDINLCSVGKAPVANAIGEIMGIQSKSVEEKTARVMCGGNCDLAIDKYVYSGPKSCKAASRLGNGAKSCPNGCLGLGSCVNVCKFDAISIINGIAVIDEDKCTACGMCIKECPKKIIDFVPKKNKYYVECKNSEKGALANKYCAVSCIGCKKCEKECPNDAIKVNNNFAKIDYDLCSNCGACAVACPKHIIKIRGNNE